MNFDTQCNVVGAFEYDIHQVNNIQETSTWKNHAIVISQLLNVCLITFKSGQSDWCEQQWTTENASDCKWLQMNTSDRKWIQNECKWLHVNAIEKMPDCMWIQVNRIFLNVNTSEQIMIRGIEIFLYAIYFKAQNQM